MQQHTTEQDSGRRLDKVLKYYYPSLPFSKIAEWIRKGKIRVDGKRCRIDDRVETGQTITGPDDTTPLTENEPAPSFDTSDFDSWILLNHKDFLIINKPYGLAVQGGKNIKHHLDGVLQTIAQNPKYSPFGSLHLVHRLDRDTSGVMIIAKHAKAAEQLSKLFREHHIQKHYWALVEHCPQPSKDWINTPIPAPNPKQISTRPKSYIKKTSDKSIMQEAKTYFQVIKTHQHRIAWVECLPKTGRKHQLRIHLSSIGHPILGDPKYGGDLKRWGKMVFSKLCLHARALGFVWDGKKIHVIAPPSPHFAQHLKAMGFSENP